MDCPHIPEMGHREFSKRIYEKAAAERVPVVGSVELTLRCNLRCKHCYVGDYRAEGVPVRQELRFEQWRTIFDQLADAGTLWMLLTGGEPLLHPDFKEIYSYAKSKGFVLTLFTNGTAFSPSVLDLISEMPPFAIEISLYGLTQETYESVTGIPGSHAKCMKGIDELLGRGLPLQLKTMVMSLNRHELWDMKAYAERLEVRFRYDPMIHGAVDGTRHCLQYRLSPEEVVALDVEDAARFAAWQELRGEFEAGRDCSQYLYACNAGIISYHIDPTGQLSLCISSNSRMYDLCRGSFAEGWAFLREVRYQQVTDLNFPCNGCSLRVLCGVCPEWTRLEGGAVEQPVPYLCEVARLRKQHVFLIPEEVCDGY